MFNKRRRELEKKVRDLEWELEKLRNAMVTIHQLTRIEDNFHVLEAKVSNLRSRLAASSLERENLIGISDVQKTQKVEMESLIRLSDEVSRHEDTLQKLLLMPGLVEVPEVRVAAHYELPSERKPEGKHDLKGMR